MGNKSEPECSRVEASIQLRCAALALIRENRRLFELLRENADSDERDDTFDTALASLKDLKVVSREITLAFWRTRRTSCPTSRHFRKAP
jgi:hypothetical protein